MSDANKQLTLAIPEEGISLWAKWRFCLTKDALQKAERQEYSALNSYDNIALSPLNEVFIFRGFFQEIESVPTEPIAATEAILYRGLVIASFNLRGRIEIFDPEEVNVFTRDEPGSGQHSFLKMGAEIIDFFFSEEDEEDEDDIFSDLGDFINETYERHYGTEEAA